jgi:CRISPR-associated protein Csm2
MRKEVKKMPGSNPRESFSHDVREEKWLKSAKEELGENFVDRVLSFERMDPEAFKAFHERLKKFIQNRREIHSSRMRKVYEVIRGAESLPELLLALPKLAYMVGKEEKKNDLGVLYTVLAESINRAKDAKDLQSIRKFTEALVAYHKFYADNKDRGGREQ